MSDGLVLWGVGTSRTIRVHWALQELGLSYRTESIQSRTGETARPEYIKLNPRHKIPLLQDGEFTIGESAAILAYLADKYADSKSALLPEKGNARAQWLEWCFFIVTELDSTSLYIMRRHGLIRGLAHLYGHAPDVVKKAGEYFCDQLKHVDTALSDGRPYLMGEQFTTADILLTTCLNWAVSYDLAIYENTKSYLERTTSRGGFLRGVCANEALPG